MAHASSRSFEFLWSTALDAVCSLPRAYGRRRFIPRAVLTRTRTLVVRPSCAALAASTQLFEFCPTFLPTIRAQLCAPKLGISKLPLTSGPPGTAGASVTCPRASAPACILYARPRPRPRLPCVLAKLCDLIIMYPFSRGVHMCSGLIHSRLVRRARVRPRCTSTNKYVMEQCWYTHCVLIKCVNIMHILRNALL